MIQYQYHDENGNSFNLTRKCIRCKGDLTEKQAKLGVFSCDECWPIIDKRMKTESSGNPYRA